MIRELVKSYKNVHTYTTGMSPYFFLNITDGKLKKKKRKENNYDVRC